VAHETTDSRLPRSVPNDVVAEPEDSFQLGAFRAHSVCP
jgi:hypothetical protein